MDRPRVRRLALAGLAVLAVALTAAFADAWIENPDRPGLPAPGPGGSIPFDGAFGPGDPTVWALVIILLVLAMLAYTVLTGGTWRRSRARAIAIGGVIVLLMVVVLFVIFGGEIGGLGTTVSGSGNTSQGAPGGGGDGMTAAVPPTIVWALVGLVALGAIAIAFQATRREAIDAATADDEDEAGEEGPSDVEIARAAGRAAERLAAGIDQPDGEDNDVYRAWLEMTDLLDLAEPETATPGEFAARAVDLGLNARHVATITRLFEEVRYGERPPSREREEAALRALRSIEATHSGRDHG